MPVGLSHESPNQIQIGCNIRQRLQLVNNLLAAESRKNRYCARGIPSDGSRVVFARLRKYGKVYNREIVTAQSPSILSKHEIC